jgi:putative addiction module component (TIGR02574 family)
MAPKQLLAEALKLPMVERARLARELVKSLDQEEAGEDSAVVQRAWATEIERRARRAMRGKTTGRDWDTAIRSIAAKLRRR